MGRLFSRSDGNGADRGDDQLAEDPPRNTGRGSPLMYSRTTRRDAAVELLSAYKWHVGIVAAIAAITLALGWWSIPSLDDVPPEVWSAVYYLGIGTIPGTPVAYYLWKRWYSVEGVEVWDLDPVSNQHRHLRLGEALWDDLTVLSPWGSEVGIHELQRCEINGRQGYEVMDLRVKKDGQPVCVATWMGEANSAMLRTYRLTLVYARRRLARRANAAMMEQANREPIAREVAERVVAWHIRQGQETGVPGAGEIETVVEDVMADMGLQDPLAPDDLDLDADEWTPRDADANGQGSPEGVDELSEAIKAATNGGGEP